MKKLEIIIRHSRLHAVKEALTTMGVKGMTVSDVKGFGQQGGVREVYRGNEIAVDFLPKIKIEAVVNNAQVEAAIAVIREAANTNTVGDGKIFVLPVETAVRIRTGESGEQAL